MGSEKRCQSSRSTVQCSAKSLPNLADKSKLIIIKKRKETNAQTEAEFRMCSSKGLL